MNKREDKMKLEQEVNELENQVYNLTGYRNNRDELRAQYEKDKSDYKKNKKKVAKIKGIRNLKVMGNISLLLVPFVVCGGFFAGTFAGYDTLLSNEKTVDFGDEVKIVSMDSTGTYDENFEQDGCKDSITINTKWFKENDTLVRYTYELEESVDFHTREEIEDVVSKDYFTLLNAYNFTETNKEVAEITEDRINSDLGEDVVSVKAGLGINEEEANEINSSLHHDYGIITVLAILSTGIPGTFFGFLYPRFGYFKETIESEVKRARSKLFYLPEVKQEKKKLKELKKKIK